MNNLLFWAEPFSPITGLDHLGIRNSSQTVYSLLLSGLSNVTNRLRYYGFYTWCIDRYFRHSDRISHNKAPKQFYTYIRRAEVLWAYINSEEQGIGGVTHIREQIDKGESQYRISESADRINNQRAKYWLNRKGVFGQVYSSSLVHLDLIKSHEDIYLSTDKGQELADAFCETVGEDAEELFWDIIIDDKLQLDDLEDLEGFLASYFIDYEPEELGDNEEWCLYNEYLSSADGLINDCRKETIQQVLYYYDQDKTKEGLNALDFPAYVYDSFVGNIETVKSNQTTLGWYYYRCGELLHYAQETMLWGLLGVLCEEDRWIPLPDFLETTSKNISEVKEKESHATSKEIVPLLEKAIKKEKYEKGMYLALKLLLAVHSENQAYWDDLNLNIKDSAIFNSVLTKSGNVMEVVNIWIKPYAHYTIKDFAHQLLKNTINQHLEVAYEKMALEKRDSCKFVIENYHIKYLEAIYPTFTSPRLQILESFLKDLQLISEESPIELTDLGIDKLNNN